MLPSNTLPESERTYWRWGIPSLILALATVCLILLSQWVVDPGITVRYERIVSEVLGGTAQQMRDIRRAELAAQRLMTRFPQDARYRTLHAEVCFKGTWVAMEDLATQASEGALVQQGLMDDANSYQIRGEESMRSATRLAGVEAVRAQAWVLRAELLKSSMLCSLQPDRLAELSNELERFSGVPNPALPFYSAAALSIRQGHQSMPLLEKSKRDQALQEGVEEIRNGIDRLSESQRNSLTGLTAKAWLVEGLSSLDPDHAIQIAREAIVQHASQLQALNEEVFIGNRIEAIDAFFRCMMLVSGPDEAMDSVVNRLDQVPSRDRNLFRHVLVASNLRILVSQIIYPQGGFGELALGDVLRSVLRISPDHPELIEIMDRYFFNRPEDIGVLSHLLDIAGDGQGGDPFLRSLVWMKDKLQSGASEPGEPMVGHPEWTPRDLEAILGLIVYWLSSAKRNHLEWWQVQPIVDAMVEAYPRNGDVLLGRALLAMELMQWGAALEDLRLIRQNNPESRLVDEWLNKVEKAVGTQGSNGGPDQRGTK